MKHVVLAILLILTACNSDDEPSSGKGCLTGISKQSGQRELIRCCTREQYLAGSNTSAGGTSSWNGYSSHKWEVCPDCK